MAKFADVRNNIVYNLIVCCETLTQDVNTAYPNSTFVLVADDVFVDIGYVYLNGEFIKPE